MELIGKSFGGTTFSPNRRPVISESCAANSSLYLGVGAKGFPALLRAAPRKKGMVSTATLWALRRGR